MRRVRFRSLVGGWVACHVAACGGAAPVEVAAGDAGADPDGGAWLAPTLGEAPVRWLAPVPVEASGFTAPLRVGVAGTPVVSFWVIPSDDCGGRCCVQLTELNLDGATLVPLASTRDEHGQVCRACASRVRVSVGDGFFTLPNDGSILDGAALRLRVQIRDCESYTPLEARFGEPLPETVRVGVVEHPSPPSGERVVELRARIAEDAVLDSDPDLELALSTVNRCFSAARLRFGLRVEQIDPLGTVNYASSSLQPLPERVPDGVDGPALVLAPCLSRIDAVTGERSHPRGMSPRIPGGLDYDLLWISAGACFGATPASPEALGRVIAHELGHFYGLHHAEELDGSEDHLDDTDGDNFMSAVPAASGACELTPQQAAVVRQHISLF